MSTSFILMLKLAIGIIVVAIVDADSLWNLASTASVPLGESAKYAAMASTSAGYDIGRTRNHRRDSEMNSGAASPGNFIRSGGVMEIHNTNQKKRLNRIDRAINTYKVPAPGSCPNPKICESPSDKTKKPPASPADESLSPTKNFWDKKISQFKHFLSSSPMISKYLP